MNDEDEPIELRLYVNGQELSRMIVDEMNRPGEPKLKPVRFRRVWAWWQGRRYLLWEHPEEDRGVGTSA